MECLFCFCLIPAICKILEGTVEFLVRYDIFKAGQAEIMCCVLQEQFLDELEGYKRAPTQEGKVCD